MTGFNLANKKVFVAGHNGMVGGALMRRLESENCELITANRKQLDLCNQAAVDEWMEKN